MPTQSTSMTVSTATEPSNLPIENLDLEFGTITDAVNLIVKITESLERLLQHSIRTLLTISTSRHQHLSEILHWGTATLSLRCAMCKTLRKMLPHALQPLKKALQPYALTLWKPAFSPSDTAFCMDREDACSLGYLQDLNRYFFLIINKGTEHFVSFPAKTCASRRALLKQFNTFTGRKISFLRTDDAKKFQFEEIVDYCAENDVALKFVVAYNHRMQARVEGAIGIKQHSRTSLLHAGKLSRFWYDATRDFGPGTMKVFLCIGRHQFQSWVSSRPHAACFLQHLQNSHCTFWMQSHCSITLWAPIGRIIWWSL